MFCSWGARQQQQSTSEWLAGGGRRRHLRQALSESPPLENQKGVQAGDLPLQGGVEDCRTASTLPQARCNDERATGVPIKGGFDSWHHTGKPKRRYVELQSESRAVLPAASAYGKASDVATEQSERNHRPVAQRDRLGSCSLDLKPVGRCRLKDPGLYNSLLP